MTISKFLRLTAVATFALLGTSQGPAGRSNRVGLPTRYTGGIWLVEGSEFNNEDNDLAEDDVSGSDGKNPPREEAPGEHPPEEAPGEHPPEEAPGEHPPEEAPKEHPPEEAPKEHSDEEESSDKGSSQRPSSLRGAASNEANSALNRVDRKELGGIFEGLLQSLNSVRRRVQYTRLANY